MTTPIVTQQMVRDVLTFKGPSSLTELLRQMKLEDEHRTDVHCHLVSMQDRKIVDYDVHGGVWISNIILE